MCLVDVSPWINWLSNRTRPQFSSHTSPIVHNVSSHPRLQTPPACCAHCLRRCVLSSIPSSIPTLIISIPGDTRVLDAAKQQIRQGFREKASLPADDPSIAPAIQHAEEVAQFLKTNLVQGRKDGDVYSKPPLGTHVQPFTKPKANWESRTSYPRAHRTRRQRQRQAAQEQLQNGLQLQVLLREVVRRGAVHTQTQTQTARLVTRRATTDQRGLAHAQSRMWQESLPCIYRTVYDTPQCNNRMNMRAEDMISCPNTKANGSIQEVMSLPIRNPVPCISAQTPCQRQEQDIKNTI